MIIRPMENKNAHQTQTISLMRMLLQLFRTCLRIISRLLFYVLQLFCILFCYVLQFLRTCLPIIVRLLFYVLQLFCLLFCCVLQFLRTCLPIIGRLLFYLLQLFCLLFCYVLQFLPTCLPIICRLLFHVLQIFGTCLPIIPHSRVYASSSSSTPQENAPSSSSTPHDIASAPPFSSPHDKAPSSSFTPRDNPCSLSSSSALHENGHPNYYSCLSSAASSVSTVFPHYPDYDVFINHRGPDVKDGFATSLYKHLAPCGFRVFLDKYEMCAGLDITCQIKHAIETASIHIVIFSPRYAESCWCLDELHQMWKACKSDRAILIPVFYGVKPSEVRWTARGPYDEDLGGHRMKQRFNPQMLQDWEDALSHTAEISGFELEAYNGGYERLLNEVAGRVLEIGRTPSKYVTKSQFQKTVRSSKGIVVGIVGAGGVGKTELAQDFFKSNRSNYSRSCFLSDAKESSGISLQRRVIKDLTKADVQIGTIAEGKRISSLYASCFHALIVLVDADDANQVHGVLSIKKMLDPNSLILVTSRHKHVLTDAKIPETSIYNITGLSTPSPKTNTKFRLGSDKLEILPSSVLDPFTSLKELWVHDSPKLKCLSGSYGLLNRLTELNIVDCGIKSLQGDMNKLEVFRVYNCPLGELSFRQVPDKVILLREARLRPLSSPFCPQDVCPNLKHLWINYCRNLSKVGPLPATLVTVDLSYCHTLREIKGLDYLAILEQLDISGCKEVEELPSLQALKSLKSLKASECCKLKRINGLAFLSNLQRLYVPGCHEIRELRGVEHCSSLKTLDARDCPKLQLTQGVLDQLRHRLKTGLVGCFDNDHQCSLDWGNCSSMCRLPGSIGIEDLKFILNLKVRMPRSYFENICP